MFTFLVMSFWFLLERIWRYRVGEKLVPLPCYQMNGCCYEMLVYLFNEWVSKQCLYMYVYWTCMYVDRMHVAAITAWLWTRTNSLFSYQTANNMFIQHQPHPNHTPPPPQSITAVHRIGRSWGSVITTRTPIVVADNFTPSHCGSWAVCPLAFCSGKNWNIMSCIHSIDSYIILKPIEDNNEGVVKLHVRLFIDWLVGWSVCL